MRKTQTTLTRREAARVLRVHVNTIRNMERRGTLKGHREDGRVVYPLTAVYALTGTVGKRTRDPKRELARVADSLNRLAREIEDVLDA